METPQLRLSAPLKVTSIEILSNGYDGSFSLICTGYIGVGADHHEFKTRITLTEDLRLHAGIFRDVILKALKTQHEEKHSIEKDNIEGLL